MTSVMLPISGHLKEMLMEAPKTLGVTSELAKRAQELACKDEIKFREANDICSAVRSARGGEGPWLHELMQGSSILLPSPPERVKSKELQQRLERLRKEQEDREYQRMVSDITAAERQAEILSDPGVKGFKESVGFGLNVIVTSYVFYLLFHECGKRLASDSGMQKMYGIFGMFISIVMHVVILMIRSSYSDGSLGKRRRAALATRNIGSSISPTGSSGQLKQKSGGKAQQQTPPANKEGADTTMDPRTKKTQ